MADLQGSIKNNYVLTGAISMSGAGNDYNMLKNKPKINGVELTGNKSLQDLGIKNMPFEIGGGLRLDNNVLFVDTAGDVEKDNTKPITSAAVFTAVGNINSLLGTI